MLKRAWRPVAEGSRPLIWLLLCTASPQAPAQGVGPLQRIVDETCRCAAQHETGLDALLSCTDGPKAFGRYKVAWREGWTGAQSRAAADLERVIETCIADAQDGAHARARLGVAPVKDDGEPMPVFWRQIPPAQVDRHKTRLVRVWRQGASPVKGLVHSVDNGVVVLSLARRDGGGTRRIPADAITEVWIMELSAR